MDLRFTDEELAFRDEVRAFFKTAVPADIRRKCEMGQRLSKEEMVRWVRILADKGWSCPAWAPEWGGTGWDAVKQYIFKEELHMAPAPEPISFNMNMIGPTLIAFGTEEQKRHFLPKIARMDYWFCQGFSEPGAGSDLAALRTTAVRDGDHYIVNGSKTFITSGMRADWITVAVRTGGAGSGAAGISALLLPGDTPGLTRTALKKMGWWCSDTAELHFDQCRVPAANLLGAENAGFALLMRNFNDERLMLAMHACYLAQACLDEALEWARQRKTFGKALLQHQAVRHKLVEMATRIEATRAFIDSIVARMDAGPGAAAPPLGPV